MIKLLTISSAAIFSLALVGCEPTTQTICPALKTYSRAELTRLAADYPSLPAEVQSLISDYRLWRRKCAALANSKATP